MTLDERLPRRLRADDYVDKHLDVFALVKQAMADNHLSQNPLLVWPQTSIAATEHFFRQVNVTRKVITAEYNPDRVQELESLADGIARDFPHMQRCVKFYRSLVNRTKELQPYPRLAFLENVARATDRWCQINLGDKAPRPKAHCLEVVFHRGRD